MMGKPNNWGITSQLQKGIFLEIIPVKKYLKISPGMT